MTVIFFIHSSGQMSISMFLHLGVWLLRAGNSWCNNWSGRQQINYRTGSCLGSERVGRALLVAHPLFPWWKPAMCFTLLGAGAWWLEMPRKTCGMLLPILFSWQWDPDSAQRSRFLRQPSPGRASGRRAVSYLCSSEAGTLAGLRRLLRREYECLSLGLGAWCSTQSTHALLFLSPITGCFRPKTCEPTMHPNPASAPTSPATGSEFHYISQEGFSFFLSEHLASETS